MVVLTRFKPALQIMLAIWVLYCGHQVYTAQTSAYLLAQQALYQEFKSKCIADGGSVRHGDSALTVSVYCREKSGDESVFPGVDVSFDVANYSLMFFHQLTLGVFELGHRAS